MIGIALERNGELRVWFLMPDGAIKSVQPSRLPEHDTAWAMTVHKSQGSEFEHAALILPARSVPLVTANWSTRRSPARNGGCRSMPTSRCSPRPL